MGLEEPKSSVSSASARPSIPKLKVDGRSTNPWDEDSDDEVDTSSNSNNTNGGNPWDAPSSKTTGDMWQQNHNLFDGLTTGTVYSLVCSLFFYIFPFVCRLFYRALFIYL